MQAKSNFSTETAIANIAAYYEKVYEECDAAAAEVSRLYDQLAEIGCDIPADINHDIAMSEGLAETLSQLAKAASFAAVLCNEEANCKHQLAALGITSMAQVR